MSLSSLIWKRFANVTVRYRATLGTKRTALFVTEWEPTSVEYVNALQTSSEGNVNAQLTTSPSQVILRQAADLTTQPPPSATTAGTVSAGSASVTHERIVRK